MIKIDKIEFQNYRQYKNISVDFTESSDYNIHILKAKNGIGKTTFLNGILWCLYEKEHYINDASKALKVINESIVQETNSDNLLEVCVKITISDEDKSILFKRSQKFNVSLNLLTQKKVAVATSDSILEITETPKNSASNSRVYESEEETQRIVKQYFDETIYNYYFFDGENLKTYFDRDKNGMVKSSIFNLSQVTLLDSAYNHAKKFSEEKARQIANIKGIDAKIYDEIDKLEDEIKRAESENRDIENSMPGIDRRISEFDSILKNYAPIKDSQVRREQLTNQLNKLKQEYDELRISKHSFIRKYYMLFNLYPRIKSTLDTIIEKQKAGMLPPSIDKSQIKNILNNHVSNCPVCDGAIDEKAIKHLENLLNQLDVSAKTSNYLMEIKGSLEEAVKDCEKYSEEKEKIITNEKYYTERISEINKELDEISAYLSKYSNSENDKIDVAKIEKARKNYIDQKINKQTMYEINKKTIKTNEILLEEKRNEMTAMETKERGKSVLEKQVSVLRILYSKFYEVEKSIMDEIKIDIQKMTWECFDNMIWKKETFSKLSINDNYEMTVYNVNENDMTGSMSATENMALAYAFTLAIHKASGRNCPLVVDSPLGRVSDDNRVNMANELLKISKEKQIIMLFTPDEYSKEVAEIYDSKVSTIRDITMSLDEKEIEKVGV